MGRIGVSPWVRDDAVVREKLDEPRDRCIANENYLQIEKIDLIPDCR
jgi:hypothetical protein